MGQNNENQSFMKEIIPTINFHLTEYCNYKCKFCFATFKDSPPEKISKEECKEIVKILAESKIFTKINFAGGEPTAVKYLPELIKYAKRLGLTTSIVSNGSKLSSKWLEENAENLDILALSIDSICTETNIKSGRVDKDKIGLSEEKIKEIAQICRQKDIFLKINTVVHQYNKSELLGYFINEINPSRWKILQVIQVIGQNEASFEELKISKKEFDNYCLENEKILNSPTLIIKEDESLIKNSYLMLNPEGKFYYYNSENKKYEYTPKIQDVGLRKALQLVDFDIEKFRQRGGFY